MLNVYSAEEWFDNFYPKEWGDWREYYNSAALMDAWNSKPTPCLPCDYPVDMITSQTFDGKLKVSEYLPYLSDKFFIEVGDKEDEDNVAHFLQPYFNPQDGKYYARVEVSKMESNLDIDIIYIVGCDDSSFTTRVIGEDMADFVVWRIKNEGVDFISSSNDWFFTN